MLDNYYTLLNEIVLIILMRIAKLKYKYVSKMTEKYNDNINPQSCDTYGKCKQTVHGNIIWMQKGYFIIVQTVKNIVAS